MDQDFMPSTRPYVEQPNLPPQDDAQKSSDPKKDKDIDKPLKKPAKFVRKALGNKVAIILLVVVLAAIIAYSISSRVTTATTPDETADQFVSMIKDGEANEAYDLFSEEYKTTLSIQQFEDQVYAVDRKLTGDKRLSSRSIQITEEVQTEKKEQQRIKQNEEIKKQVDEQNRTKPQDQKIEFTPQEAPEAGEKGQANYTFEITGERDTAWSITLSLILVDGQWRVANFSVSQLN